MKDVGLLTPFQNIKTRHFAFNLKVPLMNNFHLPINLANFALIFFDR